MINGPVEQEDTTIINAYVPRKRASIYIKQTQAELKRERDKSTIIVKDFIIYLWEIEIKPIGKKPGRI